jgi:signal transduction histidine kinase
MQKAVHMADDKSDALRTQLATGENVSTTSDADRDANGMKPPTKLSADRHRALVEIMDQGFCVIEMIYGGKADPLDFRFLEANPAFFRLTGLKDALTTTMREMVPGHDQIWFDTFDKVCRTGDPIRIESPARAMQMSFDVFAFRLGELGSYTVGIIFTNMTERKALEAELIQSNTELARSNADLQQFAYAASHDLQEPLRSVASCVQMLKKRYGGQMDARADQFIEHAVGAAHRMGGMISDLLNFSRLSSGTTQIEAIESKVAVDTACANLAESRSQASATVTLGSLPIVHADLSQLTQLFQNLIGNALKFRGSKNAVVHIDARPEGTEWVFSVADQGIGMEPQYFERIFQLFQRLHTRDEYAGTGIGLTLCQKCSG